MVFGLAKLMKVYIGLFTVCMVFLFISAPFTHFYHTISPFQPEKREEKALKHTASETAFTGSGKRAAMLVLDLRNLFCIYHS